MPRIIFEYGVLAEYDDDRLILRPPHWPESFDNPESVYERYGLHPVALLGSIPFEDDSCAFYSWRDRPYGDSPHHHELSWFENRVRHQVYRSRSEAESPHEEALARATDSIAHRLWAVRYHLERMVDIYGEMARVGAGWFDEDSPLPTGVGAIEPLDVSDQEILEALPPAMSWIGRVPTSRLGVHLLSGGPSESIFFEQQSFLSAARIVLDRVQPLLSLERWAKKKALPRSFTRLVAAAEMNAPRRLEYSLTRMLEDWADELIAYRDCVEHFAELAPHTMIETQGVFSDCGYIASTCMLPDNPQSRSRNRFTFERGVDCLSYSCRIYARLLIEVHGLIQHAEEDVATAKRQAARRRAARKSKAEGAIAGRETSA